MLDRVFPGAGQRADDDTRSSRPIQHEVGRHAERVDHHLHRVRKRGVENDRSAFLAQVVSVAVADIAVPQPLGVYAVLGEYRLDVGLVLRWYSRLHFGGGEGALLAIQAGRYQQVDAIGVAIDVVVEPAQLDIEGFRGVAGATEHTESAGVAHGGDHVATMAECEQRELDVEHGTDFVVHGRVPGFLKTGRLSNARRRVRAAFCARGLRLRAPRLKALHAPLGGSLVTPVVRVCRSRVQFECPVGRWIGDLRVGARPPGQGLEIATSQRFVAHHHDPASGLPRADISRLLRPA